MPAVALRAHFDGERIVLDEEFALPANAPFIGTLLSADPNSEEAWLRAASSSDAFAFLANPAEDIYTSEDGEPMNHAV